jgi:O-antigen ligase
LSVTRSPEQSPSQVGVVARYSFWVLLVFAASIPVEDSVQFGIGRLSKLAGLAAFAAWACVLFVRGRLRPLTAVHLFASAFVVWSIGSYFWSLNTSDTLAKCITLVQMVAVVWMVLDQARTRYDITRLMRAFIVGAALSAFVTSLHAHQGQASVGGKRFTTNNAGPNNAGALLAVAVMMALYLLAADPDRRWKWFYMLFLPIGAVGVILSASRGALVAFAVGVALNVVTARNLRGGRLLLLVSVGAIGLVLGAVLVPQNTLDRLGTTQSEIQSGSLNNRLLYWKTAYRIWGQHPVQGIGSGAFQEANSQAENRAALAHSMYVSVGVETGVIGFSLLLVALLLAAFGGGWHERRSLRRAWFAIWATWALGAASLTWEDRKITWFILAIGAAHAVAVRRERQAALTEASAEISPGDQRTDGLVMVTSPG